MSFRSVVMQPLAMGLLLQASSGAEKPEEPAQPDGGSVVTDLDEMVVIGTRTRKEWIDASGTVLHETSEDLLRNGTQDLGGIAKYDPTISLPFDFGSGDGAFAYGQSGYGSINIRGVEGNRVAIELDGIRQPPEYVSTSFDIGAGDGAGGIGRDYFDPAMFEVVEVLKGGGSALYGSDALGGVVTFKTPDPESFLKGRNYGGMVRTQFFSANQSLASQVGGAFKTGRTSVMFLIAGREGEETENNGHLPPNPGESHSLSSLLKVEHEVGDSTFKAAFETFDRHALANVRSAVVSKFKVFDDYVYNEQQLERQRASLRWEWKPKDAWITELDTMAYWQHAGSGSENQSASLPLIFGGQPIPGTERTRKQRIDFDTDIGGFSSIARKEIGQENAIFQTFLAGIDVSLEQGANKFTRFDTGAPDDENRTSFAPTDTFRSGFFLQDEVAIQRKWIITPGIRFDYQTIDPHPNQAYLDRLKSLDLGSFGQSPPTDYSNFAVSPRLNLAWKPKDFLQVYGSYAHGVRNPSAEELSMIFDHPAVGGTSAGTLTVPNPGLKEEESNAFELGVKGDGKAGRAQAAVYYTRYKNFIENGVDTGKKDDENKVIVTTVNRGEAEIYGFELSGTLKPSYWWSNLDGWEVGASTGKSIGNNLTDHQPINTVDPWKTVGFIGYTDPSDKFGARLVGTYTAKVTRVNEDTNQGEFFRPPSWFTLDLNAFWRVQDTLTVNVGFNNIFDEKYWSWSTVRRGNGHLGGDATDDRSTAPGRNFSISITKTF